jgi:hypothetical protein
MPFMCQRTWAWHRAVLAADVTGALRAALRPLPDHASPLPPPPLPDAAVSINGILNEVVARRDRREYASSAEAQGRQPLFIAALTHDSPARPQPYLAQYDISAFLMFRAGHMLHDVAPGGMVLTHDGVRAGPTADLREPPYLRCPECYDDVNSEHDDHTSAVRRHHIMVHRLTCCVNYAPALKWYHDVAVTIVPTLNMAQALVRLRCGLIDDTLSTEAWRSAAAPFLQHLLSPTDLCDKHNPQQHRDILRATSILLSYQDGAAVLPLVQDFGAPPRIPVGVDGLVVTASGDAVDDVFWKDILRLAPPLFVPPALPARGLEADARLRVRRPRRCTRRGDMA